jgi:uncharacterized protein with HEPN domain
MDERPDVTTLHVAAQEGRVDEIVRLVEAGADVNQQDDNGITPLKYASAEPYPAALKKLLELGAEVDLADRRGFTPLHCAAGHGFYPEAIEMATILIEHGANVNAKSVAGGFVPLHVARTEGMLDLLLDHGADPGIRSNAGKTPLEQMIEDREFTDAEHLTRRLKLFSTPPQPAALGPLNDILKASGRIFAWSEKTNERKLWDDRPQRASIERQFEIIGAALGRLRSADEATWRALPRADFVMRLADEIRTQYDSIDYATLWRTKQQELPLMLQSVAAAAMLLRPGPPRE